MCHAHSPEGGFSSSLHAPKEGENRWISDSARRARDRGDSPKGGLKIVPGGWMDRGGGGG